MRPPSPITIRCRLCGAGPGEHCKTTGDVRHKSGAGFHAVRWKMLIAELWREVASLRARSSARPPPNEA